MKYMRRKIKIRNLEWIEHGDGHLFSYPSSGPNYAVCPVPGGHNARWGDTIIAFGSLEYCMFACALHKDCRELEEWEFDRSIAMGTHG